MLPLFGAADMDLHYLLGREQQALHNASVAASGPARLAHEGMARVYRRLLTEAGLPQRSSWSASAGSITADEADRWMDDGGSGALTDLPHARVNRIDATSVSAASASCPISSSDEI